MRELYSSQYSTQQFSDETLLLNFKLVDPVTLTRNLTWLWGKETDEFPLTFLTEGQNGGAKKIKPISLNDTQYKWPVIGRMRHTSKVIGLSNTNVTTPGIGGSLFQVDFLDATFKKYEVITSPDGAYQLRIEDDGEKLPGKVRYTVGLMSGTSTTYVAVANFVSGLFWVSGATKIAASKSVGISSNHMAPGMMTSQFGYYRYGYEIAGNVSNKVINIELEVDGSKSNQWIPFDFKLWQLDTKKKNEEALWYDEYNRDTTGKIYRNDMSSGEPVPSGAGVKQILKTAGNYSTYSKLTLNILKSTVRSVLANRVDHTPTEVVLYTGRGGADQFHNAIMVDAVANQYFQALGDKNIEMGSDGLTYGKYFNRYKTIDGDVITVKVTKMFDFGKIAEMQKANGDTIDGLPRESYTMVFLDQSKTDSGERNISMVYEEGREVMYGIYKGMSPIPAMWGGVAGIERATRTDASAFDVLGSQGIHLANYTTSFWLEKV